MSRLQTAYYLLGQRRLPQLPGRGSPDLGTNCMHLEHLASPI